jgi:hypothetical protein
MLKGNSRNSVSLADTWLVCVRALVMEQELQRLGLPQSEAAMAKLLKILGRELLSRQETLEEIRQRPRLKLCQVAGSDGGQSRPRSTGSG